MRLGEPRVGMYVIYENNTGRAIGKIEGKDKVWGGVIRYNMRWLTQTPFFIFESEDNNQITSVMGVFPNNIRIVENEKLALEVLKI